MVDGISGNNERFIVLAQPDFEHFEAMLREANLPEALRQKPDHNTASAAKRAISEQLDLPPYTDDTELLSAGIKQAVNLRAQFLALRDKKRTTPTSQIEHLTSEARNIHSIWRELMSHLNTLRDSLRSP
jgi:hypothetical protein